MSAPGQPAVRMQMRRTLVLVSLCIAVGLLLLFLFDRFRPPRAPSVGMLVAGAWRHVRLLSALLVLLLACWCVLRHRRGLGRAAGLVRSAALAVGLVLGVPLALIMLEELAYNPIKFGWLIHRVEAASSAEEEKAAFRTASRWGRIWELNRIRREHLPARAQHIEGASVLEVEWLESGPAGRPYRAYRRVLDERNMDAFDEQR